MLYTNKKHTIWESLMASDQRTLIEDRRAKCFRMYADSLILLAASKEPWKKKNEKLVYKRATEPRWRDGSDSTFIIRPTSSSPSDLYIHLSFPFLFSGVVLLSPSWRNQLRRAAAARRRLPASSTRDLLRAHPDFSYTRIKSILFWFSFDSLKLIIALYFAFSASYKR